MILNQSVFIDSIARKLQEISWQLPVDFFCRYEDAYNKESSESAKYAMEQVLNNSVIAARLKRPVCQDTGIVIAFLEIGDQVLWDENLLPDEMVNIAVKKAYNDFKNNLLRASIVSEPSGIRKNTCDNTPAVTHINLVHGNTVNVKLIAKGGGSEFKTAFTVLNPGDNITNWVKSVIYKLGAGWCPPGIAAIGIGGSAEKAMLLSKEALFMPLNINEILLKKKRTNIEQLRLEIFNSINSTGIGAQGFGGDTTVLDVLIKEYPTHAAILPVALTVSCSATRHTEYSFPAEIAPSKSRDIYTLYNNIEGNHSGKTIRSIKLPLSTADIASLTAGDRILLSGKVFTARDAAHKRLMNGEYPTSVDLRNACIYYAGPVEAVAGEIIGPAGPTTSKRMDKYSKYMLETAKVNAMIGKGERSEETNKLIAKHKAIYFAATGGAACYIAQRIKYSKIVAFDDLGMEAIREVHFENLPVIVATDCNGNTIYKF